MGHEIRIEERCMKELGTSGPHSDCPLSIQFGPTTSINRAHIAYDSRYGSFLSNYPIEVGERPGEVAFDGETHPAQVQVSAGPIRERY